MDYLTDVLLTEWAIHLLKQIVGSGFFFISGDPSS